MKTEKSFHPTSADVRKLREEYGMGVQEAVRVLKKSSYMEACQEAKTVQDLAEILFRLIEDKY